MAILSKNPQTPASGHELLAELTDTVNQIAIEANERDEAVQEQLRSLQAEQVALAKVREIVATVPNP